MSEKSMIVSKDVKENQKTESVSFASHTSGSIPLLSNGGNNSHNWRKWVKQT